MTRGEDFQKTENVNMDVVVLFQIQQGGNSDSIGTLLKLHDMCPNSKRKCQKQKNLPQRI